MRPFAVLLLFALVATPSLAQNTPRQVTAEDYARAERQLQQHTSPLVFGGAVSPNWMDDGRFWYENQTSEGSEFVLVEPAEARRTVAFDHQRMAAGLSTAVGQTILAGSIPVSGMMFAGGAIVLDVDLDVDAPSRFICDRSSYACSRTDVPRAPGRSRTEVFAPNGEHSVFIQDH
ncbi:MAG: hypothetical protein HN645_07455, partial [Gemmatimonadales bacterium]|nr:hypothetical protein [Gemmatimonadales bacterium]